MDADLDARVNADKHVDLSLSIEAMAILSSLELSSPLIGCLSDHVVALDAQGGKSPDAALPAPEVSPPV